MSSTISTVSAAPPIDWPARPAVASGAAPTPRPVQAAVRAPAAPDPVASAQAAARQLQEYLQKSGHNMEFAVDQTTGMTIVRIYNSASGELVRQIPSEEIVRIAALLREDAGHVPLSVRA